MTNLEIGLVVASAVVTLAVNYLIVRDFKKHVSQIVGKAIAITHFSEKAVLDQLRIVDQGLWGHIRTVGYDILDHTERTATETKNVVVDYLSEHADKLHTAAEDIRTHARQIHDETQVKLMPIRKVPTR